MEKKTFSEKFDAFMMKDTTFILLVMGAAAAIFAGTYMFITLGTGAFNDLSIVAMLKDGMDGGDYAAAAGFAAGFLIARVLEGPLVGYRRYTSDWCWYRYSGAVSVNGLGVPVLQFLCSTVCGCCNRPCDGRCDHPDP